ncbi:hypothetical protein EMCRGX_G015445 [Ephydatia muelleri]
MCARHLRRMFFGQKALFMVILILGVTMLLALLFYCELLDSASDDDHVRLLGAHHHTQTVKNEDIDHNRREDIVMPLPGVDASVGPVLNTEVPVDRVDLNAPELNAHTFNEQADGNVSVGSLHKRVDPSVPAELSVSDSPTVQAISSQQASTGYVFSVTYWEQLASGTCNIMSLQCWAGKLTPPMLVLQPFYWDGWPRSLPYMLNVVTFSDVFDIDRFALTCRMATSSRWKEFNTHIFGHLNPGSVSVVFKEWRGISARNKFRVILNDSNCEWHYVPIRRAWSPSEKVKAAAIQYIERFLGNGKYVAVMMRLEWALRGRNTSYLQDIMNRVLNGVKNMQERADTSTTFLTADIGKFGSATLQVPSLLWESFSAFFDQLYKGSKSVLEWEKSFEQVSGTEDRDFVAMLQATVVSHAKCVIFVGHGNFQKHTKYMYEDAHGNEPAPCVEHIH